MPGFGADDFPGKRNVAAAYSKGSGCAGYAKADVSQSTVNLVTCVLGAGALGYPFCFKECGLVLATLIMFVTLVATRISYQLLLHCGQLCTRRTYEGIAESALGRGGRTLLELCIAAMNLGALVAFLDILADVLSAVAGTIIPPGAEPSRHAYITGVTVVGALPVCLVVRDYALIAALSNASVVFVVIFAVVVFCTAFAPYAAAALGFKWALSSVAAAASTAAAAAAGTGSGGAAAAAAATLMPPVLHMWHVQGVLVSLPVMAYGFTAHQYYMGIYTMLKAPSVRKMKHVTDLALLICAGVYWTVGVGGYATFGERTAGDIIRNLGGQRTLGLLGAYARALKLCYGMAILGNIPLHALVVFLVLGLGLASALWLPNVELIFGLTGSTASVLVAFIIPAMCFIKLYESAPELGGGGSSWESSGPRGVLSAVCYICYGCCGIPSWLASFCSSSSAGKGHGSPGSSSNGSSSSGSGAQQQYHSPVKGQVLVVPELRAQWMCRHRLAVLLLVFGVISGLLCTDAILSSISEEKAVVQLAQELVKHEAVVAEASRAQQKAKEAAAAVDAVSNAAQQLSNVTSNTNNTLGALTAAAEALNTIAAKNGSGSGAGDSHSMWDLKGRLEDHKAKVAEEGVLKNVEAALSAATADITATMDSVTKVVIKLDASIAQIKADAAAAAAAAHAPDPPQQQQQHHAPGTAAPDGTVLPEATGSSHIVPHGQEGSSNLAATPPAAA
ncbi:hypothetical protein OEZ85_000749 [Tetradesmus obliquus]|uniref:Amino acid transporter transmembrane domain-containing protein n=1 Tax=Tetradesmus obliquus TaxID=3088 RepID=A0ABY8UJ45_TETOB|nr:hypothetical protein OEZ85_000749 [Tetradesmus obliquus]